MFLLSLFVRKSRHDCPNSFLQKRVNFGLFLLTRLPVGVDEAQVSDAMLFLDYFERSSKWLFQKNYLFGLIARTSTHKNCVCTILTSHIYRVSGKANISETSPRNFYPMC
jgi:hypothetical protein